MFQAGSRSFAILCLTLLAASSSMAQEFRGAILGRVTDSSGAVVPAASVKVTNEETNVALETHTNHEGNFNAPYLVPGRYAVAVMAKGFRKTERPNVVVQINDRIEVNLTLEIGATTETVVIKAESPMLQTATSDLGQVADSKFLQDTVLTTSVMNLANMAPGVLATGSLSFGGTMGNGQNSIAVNGGNGTQNGNEITI